MVGRRNASTAALRTDVRAELLSAATRLFAAHGFEATPIQAIADAVGIAKPSLLHHFPSKEELRRAVLDQMLEHWTKTLPRLLLAATAAEDRFEAVTQALVTFFLDDPDRARLLVREALDRPEEMRELLSKHVQPWMTAVAAYVRKGQEHGTHFRDIDAEAYVVCIMQMVVTAIAAEQTTSVLLGPARKDSRARLLSELLRIAKASLFLSESETPTPRKRARR